MNRSNPFVGLFEERFGPPAGAALAIVHALPRLREAIADEAEELAVEAVTRAGTAGEKLASLAPGDVARVEALRPIVAQVMLGGVGEIVHGAVGKPEPADTLLHALEHELMLPPAVEPAGAGDAALTEAVRRVVGDAQGLGLGAIDWTISDWRHCGTRVARGVLFGEAVSPTAAEAPASDASPPGTPAAAATAPAEEQRVYASLGRRLVAVLADFVILFALWMLGALVAGLAGRWTGTDTENEVAGWIVMLSPIFYFSVFELFWRATPGKALLGLVVAPDHAEGMDWPGRILLREIIGRVVNQLLWGLGYWVAFRHPHRQSWGDRMSGTVVLRRPARGWLVRTGRIAVPAAAGVGVLLAALGTASNRATRADEEASPRVDAIFQRILAGRARVDTLMTRPVDGPEAYRADMRAALDETNELERQSRLGLELTRQSHSRYPLLRPGVSRQYEQVERLWALHLDEAAAMRRWANQGLEQCCDGTPPDLLAYRMIFRRSDVTAIRQRIVRLADEMKEP